MADGHQSIVRKTENSMAKVNHVGVAGNRRSDAGGTLERLPACREKRSRGCRDKKDAEEGGTIF